MLEPGVAVFCFTQNIAVEINVTEHVLQLSAVGVGNTREHLVNQVTQLGGFAVFFQKN